MFAIVSVCVQLLELEQDVVRGLVLRQPSLLARASEGLQSKVTAYADIFGEDVGQVRTQAVLLHGALACACAAVSCTVAAALPGLARNLIRALLTLVAT
jgi:hypothetical protein